MLRPLAAASSVLASFLLLLALLLHGGCGGGGSGGGVADASPDVAPFDVITYDVGPDGLPGYEAGSTPYLVELSVAPAPGAASDAAAGIVLVPGFSPGVQDYYVRCGDGSVSVTVTMTASSGAESALVGPTKTPGAKHQTVTIDLHADQAIVAAATKGSASTEYWVRCLPPHFPVLEWSPHPDAGAPTPGYTLVGNVYPLSGNPGYAIVLDPRGVPVWYASVPGEGVFDVESLAKGQVSFIATPPAGAMTVHGLGVPDTLDVSPDVDNHDLRRLPNGDYLLFTIPIESGFDLTGLSIGLPDGGVQRLGADESVASCKILEVDPEGNVVWSWDIADHFDAKSSCTYPRPGASTWHGPDGGPAYDVYHCNSIDADPVTGNLLVSARNLDAVFYVDKASQRVVWKMGGTTSSKDGAIYVPVADPFFRQHDARLLSGWSESACGGHGPISMFDDETERAAPARAVVYDVTVGAGGGAGCGARGATVAWQYAGPQSSLYMGSFRILPDGSRTIGWGINASGLIASEVDSEGHDLLDLTFHPGESYRAVKVPLGQLDIRELRRTSGK